MLPTRQEPPSGVASLQTPQIASATSESSGSNRKATPRARRVWCLTPMFPKYVEEPGGEFKRKRSSMKLLDDLR